MNTFKKPAFPNRSYQVKSRRKVNHGTRASLCEQYGVKNTGRQWNRLRRQLRRIAKSVHVRTDEY